MPKADNKTKPTNVSVTCYLASIAHDRKRQDAMAINSMMRRLTGVVPKMWGNAIIGFGNTHYKYASGREGDWFLVGFASRKANLVFYIVPGFDKYSMLLKRLGKFKIGKSCLYINKLTDIDMKVLEQLVAKSVALLREQAAA